MPTAALIYSHATPQHTLSHIDSMHTSRINAPENHQEVTHTEVGSSRSRMDGFIRSSCPMEALFRSPPEMPFRKKPPARPPYRDGPHKLRGGAYLAVQPPAPQQHYQQSIQVIC